MQGILALDSGAQFMLVSLTGAGAARLMHFFLIRNSDMAWLHKRVQLLVHTLKDICVECVFDLFHVFFASLHIT